MDPSSRKLGKSIPVSPAKLKTSPLNKSLNKKQR